LERFYSIYVEKYTNIDYLEYELDMYNMKDQARRVKQEKIIDQIADAHRKHEKAEIFDDHDDEDNRD
jgi:hypothetical protein